MSDPRGEPKDALSWRVVSAEPSGMMMWFDPEREAPMYRVLSPGSDGTDGFYEGGALGEHLEEGEGSPGEGSAANGSDEGSEYPGEPPPGFLDSLWEGGDHGTR